MEPLWKALLLGETIETQPLQPPQAPLMQNPNTLPNPSLQQTQQYENEQVTQKVHSHNTSLHQTKKVFIIKHTQCDNTRTSSISWGTDWLLKYFFFFFFFM